MPELYMPNIFNCVTWHLAKTTFDHPNWGTPDSTPWSQLQQRLHSWAVRLYGAQPFERMVLGIGEELGEMYDSGELAADWWDAIGDASVFSMQLCTIFRLDFGVLATCTRFGDAGSFPMAPLALIRRLNQITLKTLQETRGLGMNGEKWQRSREMMSEVLSDLAWSLSAHSGGHAAYFNAVSKTAETVMLRTRDLPALP